jgi:hypothetical protein
VAIEPRKHTTRTPTRLTCAEGNMDRSNSASFCSVRRGRRPHGTPRNFMHENRETSETPAVEPRPQVGERRLRPQGSHAHHRGVTLRHSTDESFEQRRQARRRRVRREGCGSRENTFPSDTYPTQSGTARVPRMGECADKLYAWPFFIREKNRMR